MAVAERTSSDSSADDTGRRRTVVKPLSDKLQYRFLELPNKLQAMVISDSETDKGAAAMDVRVGSFSDPDDVAGLAHFTEHMLFYASEKYPEEDEYNKFVSEHGGSTNAFTAAEHTNYHFHVNWDHLPEALDRFSQFFQSPLISADGVDREIKAVDSEHSKNINSDAWRNMQLWKHLANPRHPFHKFATGNLRTLQEEPRAAGIDVHAAMKEFYSREYSANLMRLVVYGRESLEELEEAVRGKFSGVPNADLRPLGVPPDLTDAATAGAMAKMVPVGESSILELSWLVPPEYKQYRYLPCHYLSHLLGHEGPGSVFQLLKGKKWVTSLSAGESGLSISSASIFSIRVELTDNGQEHIYDIIASILQYVMLLKSPGGISKDIFDEMKALAEMNFNFRDKMNPYSVVTNVASAMQMYPTEHTLIGMYDVPVEYNQGAIKEVLDCLTPQQVRIMWSSKLHAGKLSDTEPIYGTSYEVEKLPDDLIEEWATTPPPPELFVPQTNPFLPSDFSLIDVDPEAPSVPQVVSEGDMHKLWFLPDLQFQTPKAYMYMNFVCSEAYHTPQQAVLTRMWVKLLNDYLNPLTYPAELAGLNYSLSNSMSGFLLVVYGYNHKLRVLLEKVLEHILGFHVKEDRFLVCKEQLTREYANMKYEQPYQRAMYQTSIVCEARRWHTDEYQDEIGYLEASDLELHHRRLLARHFVEAMVIGNVSCAGAKKMMQVVTSAQGKLNSRALFPSQRPEMRIVKIPQGLPLLFSQAGPNPDNENSALVYTFQVEANDMKATCLTQLLAQIGKPAAWTQLRTVEQLGYVVFMVSQTDSTVMNLRFIIQSSTYTAQHLQDRVDDFLPMLEKNLAEMDEEEFNKQVEELSKAKLEKPKRLGTEASRIWREISSGTMVFDRPFREVDTLKALKPQDLSEFFHTYITDPSTRKLLSVQILGKNEGDGSLPELQGDQQPEAPAWGKNKAAKGDGAASAGPPVVEITNVYKYKRSQTLYASPK